MLDTWENEPAINLTMLQHTLLGTPHIAGYSLDGKIRGTTMVYRACCEFLQVAPRWESPLAPVGRRDILHAYDIRADDGRLKALLHDQTLDTARYFDQLRKTYPVRREYSGLS